jgi:hypothetical protein
MKGLALPLIVAVALSSGAFDDKKPKVSVKANPAMGLSPVRVVVTADLSGGADNEDLYCPSVEWVWGDDTRSSDKADCDPYVAGKSEIKRRFIADHTYRSAGEYQVQLILKKKDKTISSGNTMVRVRPGLGDGGGER